MLKMIYEILSKNELKWFLDSGSLLGMIREKKFLDWDRGIDISILYEKDKNECIEDAVNKISKLGFYVTSYSWQGVTYKYILTTKNTKSFKYNIDLHLFVRKGNKYVCPQIIRKVSQNYFIKTLDFFLGVKEGDPIYIKEKSVKGIMKYIAKKVYRGMICWHKNELNMEKYVPERANVYYWWIPEEFLEKFCVIDSEGYVIPSEYERYLEFRYGEWKISNPNWNFMRDDPSIVETTVDDINDVAILYKEV